MQQQTKIILFFIILFLASSIYLFTIDSRYNDSAYNKNWYSLSFVEPKTDSLNFTIENFSANTNFHWELLTGKEKIETGDVEVQTGEKKEIGLSRIMTDQKMTVRVSSGDDIQEIYKN
ncbi:MAG: hypothetical protein UT50_C0001G0064 [Candidatus Moranbacteria bacterium GW2011_GWA2_39_41]|nr:MAG: hypothetical protein UT50_C0001G0064 [Candidatus Moranbacteria bacterium GW2011_GWA2_39_41]